MKPNSSHPLQLALGLTIWIIWFGFIYGALSLGCVIAPPPPSLGPLTWINGMLLATTVLVASWLFYHAWQCWRASAGGAKENKHSGILVARVSAGLHLLAALATLAVGVPTLVLPPCV